MKLETLHCGVMPHPFSVEEGIPTEAECRALWLRFGVPDEVTVHSRMIAELARIFAIYLERTGLKFNIDLIVAGGYLHDLVKRQPDSGGVGAGILQRLGYARVSEVLELRVDLLAADRVPNEADLIFLAEQCIDEYGLGSLDGMFEAPLRLHKYSCGNVEETVSRLNSAEIIRGRVEKLLGLSLRSIVQKHRRGIQAVSVQGIRHVYLLMHGAVGFETDSAILTPRELPLCSEGIRQARALKEELEDEPLSSIYCSDLRAAVETAAIIAGPHGLRPKIRGGLREICAGEWGGSTSAEVHQLYSIQFGHDMLNYRPHGGETLFECSARVIPAFYDILNSTFGNMAIVGHPVVNRIILCQILGLSLERLFELDQSCGGVSHIYCDGPSMRLRSVNGDDRSCSRLN